MVLMHSWGSASLPVQTPNTHVKPEWWTAAKQKRWRRTPEASRWSERKNILSLWQHMARDSQLAKAPCEWISRAPVGPRFSVKPKQFSVLSNVTESYQVNSSLKAMSEKTTESNLRHVIYEQLLKNLWLLPWISVAIRTSMKTFLWMKTFLLKEENPWMPRQEAISFIFH